MPSIENLTGHQVDRCMSSFYVILKEAVLYFNYSYYLIVIIFYPYRTYCIDVIISPKNCFSLSLNVTAINRSHNI